MAKGYPGKFYEQMRSRLLYRIVKIKDNSYTEIPVMFELTLKLATNNKCPGVYLFISHEYFLWKI